MHRAGHPELRLEQILCVLPRLQAPPQLLQLRLLQRDAVAQVLDRRLRGLQLALLARCPKLLLEVFSHEGRVKRAQRYCSAGKTCEWGATGGAVFHVLTIIAVRSPPVAFSFSSSSVDEGGRS